MVMTAFARPAALLLAALPLARAAAAQDTVATVATATATATDSVAVRRGDTLWGLAATRLGSPFRWPSIHEVNVDRVADPHRIFPGQHLRLPGQPGSSVVDAPAPADTVPPEEHADAEPDHTPLSWTIKAAEPAADATSPAPRRATAWPARDSASRRAAVAALPYVGTRARLDSAGTVVSAMDLAGDGSRSRKRRLTLQDRIALTLPQGWTDGSFVLVRRGPDVGGQPVFIPTAVLSVSERSGDFAVGRVHRLFDAAEIGDRVIPLLDDSAAALGGRGRGGQETRVLWINGSAELPTIGTPLILGIGREDNVVVDDVFELRSPDQRIAGRTLAGSRVALVRVMRVGARTATALIVSQTQPGVAVGMLARPLPPEPVARPSPER